MAMALRKDSLTSIIQDAGNRLVLANNDDKHNNDDVMTTTMMIIIVIMIMIIIGVALNHSLIQSDKVNIEFS